MATLLNRIDTRKGLKLSSFLENLQNYLNERYFEQIYPMLSSEDDTIYYEILVDLLELIYQFP
jgi:hypothetical protein